MKIPSGELRINGNKVKSAELLASINPSTEEQIGEFFAAGEEEVSKTRDSAHEAFKTWKSHPIEERLFYIKKYRKALLDRMDEVAKLAAAETGSPLASCLSEISGCIALAKYYELNARDFLADEKAPLPPGYQSKMVAANKKGYITFDPMGVIGIIAPYNFPVYFALASLIPALAAGNTAILKPSKYAAFISLKIYELFEEIGLPAGVVNVINGGEEVEKYLASAKIRKLVLAGGHGSAKEVIKSSGKNITPTSIQLCGTDAMLVLADADLEEAVNGALLGSLVNSGQFCIASKRILVDRRVKAEFTKLVLNRVKKLKVGDPLDPDTDIGPLIAKDRVDRIDNFVKDAQSKGAVVEAGGKKIEGKGFYYEPTVLSNLNLEMDLARLDAPGPLINIFEFSSEDEAAAMANYPNFAVNASIWSRDKERAQKIARRLVCGTVNINDAAVLLPFHPFGGTKRSGYGRLLARDGLRDFTYLKPIAMLTVKQRHRPHWFPHNKYTYDALCNFNKFLFKDDIKLTERINYMRKASKNIKAHKQEYLKFEKGE